MTNKPTDAEIIKALECCRHPLSRCKDCSIIKGGFCFDHLKTEAIKEVVGKLEKPILSQLGISTLEKKEAFFFCLDEIDKIEKEMVGDTE